MLPPAIVVLRALPFPQLTKIATAKPIPTKMTTTPKMSKQISKSFVQVVYSENSQPTPRFALVSAYLEYKSLLCFYDMFLDLPIEKVLAIYQSGFGTSASSNREGAVYFSTSRVSKMMIYRPIRHQVLISLNAPTAEVIMANASTTVKFCNRGLVEAYSKLRVESVCKVQNGVSMFTNFVVSAIELEVIKQQFKKVAGLTTDIVVESYLPQSKSFLKILDVFYQSNNSFLPITQAQVETIIANTLVFEKVVLASCSCIMKVFSSSDMSVIWIDIQNSQKKTKNKTFINCLFNFG